MGRLVLLGLGLVAGALGVRRLQRVARSYTPAGLHGRAQGFGAQVSDFAAAVREGMAEREAQLRVALGVDAGTMDEQTAAELLERPTAPRH